jgi:hypothetical protein
MFRNGLLVKISIFANIKTNSHEIPTFQKLNVVNLQEKERLNLYLGGTWRILGPLSHLSSQLQLKPTELLGVTKVEA